ncbi:Na(+)/H(+) antiporter subunit B [Actinacidiphila sp. bgisy144]|uniref:Na(+)/H(+) antiporter subunit B n=1 Tax=Actinacidiphila sp. bgisy144 TaxID=3413791 RepID=UPI003EBA4104
MDTALIGVALGFVVVAATLAVLCREPVRQAVLLGVLGLALALLFTVLQAPDVALSQVAVGTVLTPLLILLTVRKVRRRSLSGPEHPAGGGDPEGPGGGGGS